MLLRDRGEGEWAFPEGARIAKRMTPLPAHTETEVCAPCHARRSPLRDGPTIGEPLLDGYRPALLDPGLYHADGQIDGEVYDHGSFLQSKMYRPGVTCSNCHEPHSLQLRAEGNAVCSQCHLPSAFDTPAHHFHARASPAASASTATCRRRPTWWSTRATITAFACRGPTSTAGPARRTPAPPAMPARSRPGPSPASPNGTGRPAAASACFGQALAAGRADAPGAGAGLVKLADDATAPAIARATAVAALERHLDQPALAAIQRALADPDPTIRLAAVGTLGSLDPQLRTQLGLPLLGDPVRAVRLDAARVLAPSPPRPARRSACRARCGLRRVRGWRRRPCSTGRKVCSRWATSIVTAGRLPEAEELYGHCRPPPPRVRPGLRQPRRPAASAGPRRRGRARPAAGPGRGAGQRRADACPGAAADPPAAVPRRRRGARQGRRPRT